MRTKPNNARLAIRPFIAPAWDVAIVNRAPARSLLVGPAPASAPRFLTLTFARRHGATRTIPGSSIFGNIP